MPSTNPAPAQRTNLPSSSALLEIHNTLHLLYHRNKNQHRCAKWFKSLSMLRRTTRELAWEIEKVEKSDDDVDVIGEGDGNGGSVARKLMAHLGAEVIPRSYRAFSTVVADRQFSALGVVLIALLARLSTVIGATDYFPRGEERQEESEPRDAMTAPLTDNAANLSVNTEDVGEVIARHDLDTAPAVGADEVASAEPGLGKTEGKTTSETESAGISESLAVCHKRSGSGDEERREKADKRTKKKKRKANAIDDIFGDL